MRYSILVLSFAIFAASTACTAEAHYNVRLTNGEVLQADRFSIASDKITLFYKMGSASFPRALVSSITDEAGNVDFLAEPGESKPASAEKPDEPTPSIIANPDKWPQGFPMGGPYSDKDRPEYDNAAVVSRHVPDADDPAFYDGMSPEDVAFLKGDLDIMDVKDDGGQFSPFSPVTDIEHK